MLNLNKKFKSLSVLVASLLVFSTVNIYAEGFSNNSTSTVYADSVTTIPAQTNLKSVKISDFGAHSIDEAGYSNFDSSVAINKAIQAAKNSGYTGVDFGSGRYYAKGISLESNITYFSTQGAEIIAAKDIKVWASVIAANNKSNITIQGLTVNGNKQFVFGDGMSGSFMISFTTCTNVTVQNCYLYNSKYVAILMQNKCDYITIKNNKIYDTDCGVISSNQPSNNLVIDSNTIYGSKENQNSEPIAIYNSNDNGLAHDITITNNIVHDKANASGILVMNATKVLIKGNTSYNVYSGITIGLDAFMKGSKVTASNDITITNNNIYNSSIGINGELNNSLITKNSISNIKGVGIQLATPAGRTLSSNDTVINNTITNINAAGAQEAAIKLLNTSNCTIDKNIVSDTRPTVLHYFAIQVAGADSSKNIIQNNNTLGATKKGGYQIYLQNGKNTTIKNNVATILNQGTSNLLLNNSVK